MDYYAKAGLTPYLDKLGFNLVGYGLHHLHRQLRPAAGGDLRPRCRTNDLAIVSVLSGNRNFEGPDQPRRQDELPGQPRPWWSPTR